MYSTLSFDTYDYMFTYQEQIALHHIIATLYQ